VQVFVSNTCSFVYVLNGKFVIEVSGDQEFANMGDAFFVPSTGKNNRQLHTALGQRVDLLVVHFRPEILNLAFDHDVPKDIFQNVNVSVPLRVVETNHLVQNYVNQLMYYFKEPQNVTDKLLKLKVKELAMLLSGLDVLVPVKT
jgi:hypothetical protein